MPLQEKLRFLSSFFTRPHVVGAVAPSSAGLARRMVEWIDWPNLQAVVEYGPGTGSFTRAILEAKRRESRFFAIELEPAFVAIVKRRFPEAVVHQDSVARVRALCDREGIDQVDAIVSGLPWAAFPESLQAQFMDAAMTVLKPGGQFVTFAYLQGLLLPAGRRFRRMLHHYFAAVATSRVVWLNLPPAFVYRCRR
jgi:phospholipid N-methyltransferase